MPHDRNPRTIHVAEISARSEKSFEDAAKMAIESVGNDVINLIESTRVKEQSVERDGDAYWYRVNVLITVRTPVGKPLML